MVALTYVAPPEYAWTVLSLWRGVGSVFDMLIDHPGLVRTSQATADPHGTCSLSGIDARLSGMLPYSGSKTNLGIGSDTIAH